MTGSADSTKVAADDANAGARPAHNKLAALGQWLDSESGRTGSCPQGLQGSRDLTLENRWSWLSGYVVNSQPLIAQPSELSSWRDSANDRFVRRKMNRLL